MPVVPTNNNTARNINVYNNFTIGGKVRRVRQNRIANRFNPWQQGTQHRQLEFSQPRSQRQPEAVPQGQLKSPLNPLDYL